MGRDNELIEDSELYVRLGNGRIYHVNDIPDPHAPIKDLHFEEVWQRLDAADGQFLGAGGHGQVFKEECIHDVEGSKVGQLRAVKVLQKGNESTKAHYREELKALAKFSNPKYHSLFVKSFGWYVVEHTIYINMEYLEHGDLKRHLTRQFSEQETCRIASQVVKGLGFMHKYNFIHRDLKPANLLVVHKPPQNDWWVKISDFGISKRAADGIEAYSTVNIGTREYMAPEVRLFKPRHKGEKASYTVKADMWALGSICVHLITGDWAFHDTDLVKYYHFQGAFTPDEELASNGASQDCRDFIQALMDRDPDHRLSANQAAKHSWATLNRLQFPGTPFESAPGTKPSSPRITHSELKDEFQATAQWDSGEEESADGAASKPRPSTSQPFSRTTEIRPIQITPTTLPHFPLSDWSMDLYDSPRPAHQDWPVGDMDGKVPMSTICPGSNSYAHLLGPSFYPQNGLGATDNPWDNPWPYCGYEPGTLAKLDTIKTPYADYGVMTSIGGQIIQPMNNLTRYPWSPRPTNFDAPHEPVSSAELKTPAENLIPFNNWFFEDSSDNLKCERAQPFYQKRWRPHAEPPITTHETVETTEQRGQHEDVLVRNNPNSNSSNNNNNTRRNIRKGGSKARARGKMPRLQLERRSEAEGLRRPPKELFLSAAPWRRKRGRRLERTEAKMAASFDAPVPYSAADEYCQYGGDIGDGSDEDGGSGGDSSGESVVMVDAADLLQFI